MFKKILCLFCVIMICTIVVSANDCQTIYRASTNIHLDKTEAYEGDDIIFTVDGDVEEVYAKSPWGWRAETIQIGKNKFKFTMSSADMIVSADLRVGQRDEVPKTIPERNDIVKIPKNNFIINCISLEKAA